MFFLFANTLFLHKVPRDPFRRNAGSTMPEVGVYCRRGYEEFTRARKRRYDTHLIQLDFVSGETETQGQWDQKGAELRAEARLPRLPSFSTAFLAPPLLSPQPCLKSILPPATPLTSPPDPSPDCPLG